MHDDAGDYATLKRHHEPLLVLVLCSNLARSSFRETIRAMLGARAAVRGSTKDCLQRPYSIRRTARSSKQP